MKRLYFASAASGFLVAAVAAALLMSPVPAFASGANCTVNCGGGVYLVCEGSEYQVDFDCDEETCWETHSGNSATVKGCPVEL